MDGALRFGRKIYSVLLALALAGGLVMGNLNSSGPFAKTETYEVIDSTLPSVASQKFTNNKRSLLNNSSTPQEKKISALAVQQPALLSTGTFSSPEKIQQELENALSWNELRHFSNPAHRDFIAQLAQEEFDTGNPFHLPSQRNLWKKILHAGLKDYSRKVYRSPHFNGSGGYDLVYYEILSQSGEKLFLLAYQEKAAEAQKPLSRPELATRIDFYSRSTSASETTEESWLLQVFRQNSERSEDFVLSRENLNASKQAILDMSTPLITAGR